jgi:hypothetical protein
MLGGFCCVGGFGLGGLVLVFLLVWFVLLVCF